MLLSCVTRSCDFIIIVGAVVTAVLKNSFIAGSNIDPEH